MLMDGASIVRKLNWALLPVFSVMIGCCYLDRSNVAYMQLQLRRPPPVGMGFGDSLYGNAAGLFFLSYSLFQIPSSIIVVRMTFRICVMITVSCVCAASRFKHSSTSMPQAIPDGHAKALTCSTVAHALMIAHDCCTYGGISMLRMRPVAPVPTHRL